MGRLGEGQSSPNGASAQCRPTAVRSTDWPGASAQRLAKLTGWHTRADRRAALDALEQVGMADFWRQPFASLSGGQRQRRADCPVLCCGPDLLVLDEPTSNVDSVVEARLLEVLARA